jgi:outer membrane protein
MIKKLLVLWIVAVPFAGWSQTRKLTLKECIDVALEKNLNIQRSQNNVDIFKTTLLQSKASFLPTVNAAGSYNQNFGRALNPVTNLFVNRDNNTLNAQGFASVTLINGLRLQYLLKQSQRDVLAADKDLAKAKNDVTLNVITLYVNVILNRELFENARFQLNSSEQQLDRIKKQVAAGSLPLANELNQEAQVATNEVNLINQENQLNLSLLQLKQALQFPASEVIDIEIPEIPLEDLVLDQNTEEIYAIALANMPEIASARLKVESSDFALRANRGSYYPRLSANASAQSNYASVSDVPRSELDGTISTSTTPLGQTIAGEQVFGYVPGTRQISDGYGRGDQLQDNLFRSVGIQLNVPIFNNLQTRSTVQRSLIQKKNAEIAVLESENTLRQTIETAYNDALATSKTYSSSLKQVRAQEEAYRINKQRYELGAINFVEYNVSENSLFQSKSDLVRAKYNFIFRKKVLDFYQGKELGF